MAVGKSEDNGLVHDQSQYLHCHVLRGNTLLPEYARFIISHYKYASAYSMRLIWLLQY